LPQSGAPSNPFAGLDPHAIHARLLRLGEEWAEANAAAALLEETQKPLLAQLTIGRMGDTKTTRAQAETEAMASEPYAEHIERMVEARRAANVARVRWQSAQVWADLARSANANRRAELSMGHMVP
jgi:hypothetical protein